jgi:predicted negative regulator of RcsB-dependent stress response
MASPSNASEPESPEEEEEIIAAGFDPLLFWDQYRSTILIVGALVLLGLAGFGFYEYNVTQKAAAASSALAEAASADDYRAVMTNYAGAPAAGNAAILLAGKLRDDKKYDEALDTLRTFLDKYPNHPLADAADLSIAETLEEQGKTDDALTQYQEVAAKYPDSFTAPIATIDQANILQGQGKINDARRLYQSFSTQFPNSAFSREAMGEMQLMRPAAGQAAPASNAPETAPNGLTTLPAESAPAASAAPSAPLLPVIPGSSPP